MPRRQRMGRGLHERRAMLRSSSGLSPLISLLFTLCTLLLVATAQAQVNVEPLRQQVTERRFGARIDASTTSYAGNTQGVIFGGAALMGGRTERNFGYLDVSGDYSRLAGLVSVAKWFAHLRHNFQLSAGTWWEEYSQIESDRFRRVQLRELFGVGPRFALVHGEPFELFFGSSYMVEHTELDSQDQDPRGQGTFERWSNYVAVTLKPDARILLSSVTYIQPRIDRFSDYKVLSVSGLAFTISKHLQSHIDATARYESFTPSDVRPSDLELKSSLEVVF
jgi:hypothetical protein